MISLNHRSIDTKRRGARLWRLLSTVEPRGPQLPKTLYKIVQSLKFREAYCKIVTKDYSLVKTVVICCT